MTDTLTKIQRSARMALIRSANTGPELTVRKIVRALGYKFRLHQQDLPGTPDLVFPELRAVIFVHGCFWHQHKTLTCKPRKPKSRKTYWHAKLARNVARDAWASKRLRRLGWRVMVIWECQTKETLRIARRLQRYLKRGR